MLTELITNVELVYEGEPNTYSTLHRISPWMYTNKLCAAGFLCLDQAFGANIGWNTC